MSKGQRVKITSITSPLGRTLDSLRPEFLRGDVGRVEIGPDVAGWYVVVFSGVGPLSVPACCLTPCR